MINFLKNEDVSIVETKTGYPDEIISAGQLLRILNADAGEVSSLCQKAHLKPKRDGFGNIYFSKGDVDILRKVKELYEQTKKLQEQKEMGFDTSDVQKSKVRRIQRRVEKIEPERFEFENSEKKSEIVRQEAIIPISSMTSQNAVMKKMDTVEANVISKITDVLSEKLDGLDEVIVELIKAKTENETLRQKVNELNKENFALKTEVSSFKPVALGLYVKKSNDNYSF